MALRPITSSHLLAIKAVLFVLLGTFAATLLIARAPELSTALLLVIAIWAFARAYYFCFYVIERYVDPAYRFSGIWSAIRFIVTRR